MSHELATDEEVKEATPISTEGDLKCGWCGSDDMLWLSYFSVGYGGEHASGGGCIICPHCRTKVYLPG